MRKAIYLASAGIVLAILLFNARSTLASTAPRQAGGYLTGYVYGFDMYDELVPLVWVNVTASNANYKFVASTGGGGVYGMFLPQGAYNLSVSPPGYKAYSQSVAISDGSATTINMYLYQSGVPVPEFPTQTLSLAVAFIITIGLLTKVRRRKR